MRWHVCANAIVTGAPRVRLLVTSQVVLKVERERVFRLGPLAIPELGTSAHDAMEYGAIGLFVDQAQAADPRFRVTDENIDSIIELCRQLDGLALAIKLAAVRLPLFGLRGLTQRLGDRLKLLADASRSAPTRQQTLRAALDWSYSLLSAEEQTTFRHLGVFAGACGFSLDLAGAVAGEAGQDEWAVIEQVSTLLDHSLLVDDGADPPRYRLLESARDYALHELAERHELDAAQERFARAMNSVMERFDEARLTTPDMPLLSAYARELDNVRLAIGWSLEHDPRLATALVGASSYFYLLLGLTHEHERYAKMLEPLIVSADAVDVNTARYWLARAVAESQSGFPSARAGERAASLFRALGDERGVALSLCCLGIGSGLFRRPMVGDPGGNGFACAGSVASSHEGMALSGGSRDAHRAWAFRRSTFGGRSRPCLRTIERDREPCVGLHALCDRCRTRAGPSRRCATSKSRGDRRRVSLARSRS